MYTCDTCQERLNTKPLWICAQCALKQHRDHALSECNKATREQIEKACQDIASSGGLAETYIRLTMSHLNRALKETELISELLNQQKRGFVRLEGSVKNADNDLTQEDLAASLRAANDLKQKFEQASAFASEARKGFESVLRDCREKLEDLFPEEQNEDPAEAEDSGTSRSSFDLSEFGDDQEAIEIEDCSIDAIPDLSRFTELQVLDFHWNPVTSINDNIVHTTLTELYLYGNKITEIRGLDALVNLLERLTNLVKLQYVYLEHNFIGKIEGLDTLVNLELLDLSENRIKAIENLDSQRILNELHLSRNRIRTIENISHLSKLSVLNNSENHITKLENLDTLADLEKLQVADQGIETFDGIQKLNKLNRIDADQNPIANLDHLDRLLQLEELYLYHNMISQWPEVEKLAKLPQL
ncbi:Leucine Rich Repeat family protein [Aphelenchoides avenae]|nr:Leucine Rich Repeat family protein [Aphelenchus avenae]